MASQAKPTADQSEKSKAPAISIVLRCRNDFWCLPEVLEALSKQSRQDYELIAVDNASTDGCAELLREHADIMQEIPEGGYEPGPVLNGAVAAASAKIIVFINSDGCPQDPQWLEKLVAPLEQEERKVGASYSRQIARPDATILVNFDLLRAYPPHATPDRNDHFFSFVSAAFLRERWEDQKFWDKGYAEDYEWTLRLSQSGWALEYVHDSVVMHSHNYTSKELWRKRFRHGWADAKIYGRPTSLMKTLKEFAKDLLRDFRYGLLNGKIGAILRSPMERWIQRWAFHKGSQEACR